MVEIKRRIPLNYDFDAMAIHNAIKNILSDAVITIRSDRIIHINNPGNITGTQATALKAAVLPLLTDVQDITV